MRHRWPGRTCGWIAACALLMAPQALLADGLPVLGIDVGPAGVATRDGDVRFATFQVVDRTLVTATTTDGGRVTDHAVLPGAFTIPAVAYDGSPDGLSADGRHLYLIEPRSAFPRPTTTFRHLETKRLGAGGKRIVLRGDFSLDAVSPDGSTLYLISYTSPTNPEQYDVRAFDVASGRLIPGAIVDPREPDEEMAGAPVTRVASPDGRWAYTLYMAGEPFVHALDTVGRTARCIDLDRLAGTDISGYAMRRSGNGDLEIGPAGSAPSLTVDTTSFTVRPAARAVASTAGDSGVPALVLAGAAAALIAAAAAAVMLLRRRRVSA